MTLYVYLKVGIHLIFGALAMTILFDIVFFANAHL